jgi:hypothetical protein
VVGQRPTSGILHGDSGGPVFVDSAGQLVAKGIISGATPGNNPNNQYDNVFTDIWDAIGAFPGTVMTTTPTYFGAYLYDGKTLNNGDYLLATNNAYELVMQGDGNLVLYSTTSAIWATGTQNHPNAYAAMQGDGNFCVYSSSNVALWCSGTQNHPNDWMVVQGSDGNLCIYSSSNVALWCTGT